MRPSPTLFALVVALAAPALLADSPKHGGAAAQSDPPPFRADVHTEEHGLKFHREPHAAQVHTRHGTVTKRAPIKHAPVAHAPFRKLAGADGHVVLPNGKRIKAADSHA